MLEPAFHTARKTLFHIRLIGEDWQFRSDLQLALQLLGFTPLVFDGTRPNLVVVHAAANVALPTIADYLIRFPRVQVAAIVRDGDQEMEALARINGASLIFPETTCIEDIARHAELTLKKPVRLPFFLQNRRATTQVSISAHGVPRLTDREAQLLRHVVGGQSNKEVARIYDLSPRTVEIHRAHIMKKYGARNLAQLIHVVLGGDGKEPA